MPNIFSSFPHSLILIRPETLFKPKRHSYGKSFISTLANPLPAGHKIPLGEDLVLLLLPHRAVRVLRQDEERPQYLGAFAIDQRLKDGKCRRYRSK